MNNELLNKPLGEWTLQELSKYYNLLQRIYRAEDILAGPQSAVCPGAQKLTGMPAAPGVKDKLGDFTAEIVDMQQLIEELKQAAEQERAKVEAYINSIDDEQTRLIFRLRFLHCLTWQEVAEIIGRRNTAAGVRMICKRHLAK